MVLTEWNPFIPLKQGHQVAHFSLLSSCKRHRFCVPALGKLPLVLVQLLSTFRRECSSLSAAPCVLNGIQVEREIGSVAFG